MNVNVVVLTGNLTRDPELRSLPSGLPVCEMGLAVNERFKSGQTGQYEERVNFFDITVFGGQAESCAKFLSKGRPVAVNGKLRFESWEKDGQKRSKVKVVADNVQFLNSGDGSGGNRRGSASSGGEGYSMGGDGDDGDNFQMATPAGTPAEDDIPF